MGGQLQALVTTVSHCLGSPDRPATAGLQRCTNHSETETAPGSGQRQGGATAAREHVALGSWSHSSAITQLCQAAHRANQSDVGVTEMRRVDNRK